MSEQLINYILTEMRNGHRVDSIESFLKTHGYDANDVQTSISTAIDLTAKTYIPYIQTQIAAGFSLPSIRTALLQQGYDVTIVDYAINHYFNSFSSKVKQLIQPLTNNSLTQKNQREEERTKITSRITTHLDKGFSLEHIKSILFENGFNPEIINEEINKLYQSHFHISKQKAFAFLAIFFAILFVSGFGFFIFHDSDSSNTTNNLDLKTETKLLDISVENAFPKQNLFAGDNVNFNIDIDNMGTKRDYDLYLSYSIEDLHGKRIKTKKVTKSTMSSMNDYIQIPKNIEPGKYILKIIADYKGEIPAEAFFEFEIITEKTSIQTTTSEIESTNSKQKDTQQDDKSEKDKHKENKQEENKQEIKTSTENIETTQIYQRPANSITPLEPGTYLARSYLTDVEKKQLNDYISTEGIDYAIFKCRKITFPKLELECKYYAILANNDKEFCSILDAEIRRDSCYLEFAKKSTDLDICSKIEDKNIVSACKMHILNNKNKQLLEEGKMEDFYKVFNEIYGDGTLNASTVMNKTTTE